MSSHPPESKTHSLKTLPEYFESVLSGTKPFEVRNNDREFAVGDVLHLLEWDPKTDLGGRYTGRETKMKVTYLLNGGQFGISVGTVVLGIRKFPDTTEK